MVNIVTIDEFVKLRVFGKSNGLILKQQETEPRKFYFKTGYANFYTKQDVSIVYKLIEMAETIASDKNNGEHHVFLESVVNRDDLNKQIATFVNTRHPDNKMINLSSEYVTLDAILRENGFDVDRFYKNR